MTTQCYYYHGQQGYTPLPDQCLRAGYMRQSALPPLPGRTAAACGFCPCEVRCTIAVSSRASFESTSPSQSSARTVLSKNSVPCPHARSAACARAPARAYARAWECASRDARARACLPSAYR